MAAKPYLPSSIMCWPKLRVRDEVHSAMNRVCLGVMRVYAPFMDVGSLRGTGSEVRASASFIPARDSLAATVECEFVY